MAACDAFYACTQGTGKIAFPFLCLGGRTFRFSSLTFHCAVFRSMCTPVTFSDAFLNFSVNYLLVFFFAGKWSDVE